MEMFWDITSPRPRCPRRGPGRFGLRIPANLKRQKPWHPKKPGNINDLSDESMSMTKNQQTSCFLFAVSVCRCSIFENRLAFKCGKSSKQHTPVQMLVDLAKLLSDAKHREHCSAARSLTWQANKHITYKNNSKVEHALLSL